MFGNLLTGTGVGRTDERGTIEREAAWAVVENSYGVRTVERVDYEAKGRVVSDEFKTRDEAIQWLSRHTH